MSRYAMCPDCGRRMRRLTDNWGNWDGESYYCEYCGSDYDDDDEESMSVFDAAEVWASHGKDDDYMFGYSEEELEEALD